MTQTQMEETQACEVAQWKAQRKRKRKKNLHWLFYSRFAFCDKETIVIVYL